MSERDLVVLSKNGLFGERCMGSIGSCELGVLYEQRWVSFKMVVNRTCSLGYSHSVMWSLFLVPSHGIYRCSLSLKKVWVYFLEHNDEIFGMFKGWMIIGKKETGKQSRFGGCMRYGWFIKMVMALHGLAHYSLWLQVGLCEMLDAKVVKLAFQEYSGVWFFGNMAYACMGNGFELRVKKGVFLENSRRIKRYMLWDPCTSTFMFFGYLCRVC